MRLLLSLTAAIALLTVGQAAAAPWLQAETDRFILRGEVSERVIRDYATKLAVFDVVLRANYPRATAGRATQKLHVYLVKDRNALRVVNPAVPLTVAGFFTSPAIEPFAIADVSAPEGLGQVFLFHEYAHNFMRAYMPGATPAWLAEGLAEYYGVTKIDDDKISIGGNSRGGVLFSVWLPMADVLSKAPFEMSRDERNRFYAQSWIFVHYMQSTPERLQQLGRILDLIGQGQSSVTAVQTVTGMDMPTLTRTLQAYRRITAITFPNPLKTAPAITVTRMPEPAADFQLDWLHAVRGCADDPAFIGRLRAKATRHPDEPYVQRILAQAEFRCGDPAAGEVIIDRLLAKDANDVDALRIGALNLAYAAAAHPDGRAERFQKARNLAARGYALDKADAPLIYAYVFARRVQPGYPTANDVASVRTALALSPSVGAITMLAGEVLMRSG
ncbi:hypothetical protein [Phenylobacterium immobile]|uniref:hypothetical protein n=1 Tax=Phenylobacterium immobile TaxID=21 RepID=UPI000B2EF850|nr:hypothetical protein [Phenylobacterium immobile]